MAVMEVGDIADTDMVDDYTLKTIAKLIEQKQ